MKRGVKQIFQENLRVPELLVEAPLSSRREHFGFLYTEQIQGLDLHDVLLSFILFSCYSHLSARCQWKEMRFIRAQSRPALLKQTKVTFL